MKNVIVTGANGFIGSSLIKKLTENGVNVVAIDISFANSRLPESNQITRIETSIENESDLIDRIPENEYDAFYHFAWRGVNGPEKANPSIQLANINIAVVCARVAKSLNCNKFLVAGTIAEECVHSLGNLTTTSGGMMYGVAKHCAHLMLETFCKNIGLPFVWMQFSNIYGVGNVTGNLVSYTLTEILQDREATFGPALQPYDFIYVDDLIEAIYRIGDCENHFDSYYIGSGSIMLLKDYLLKIGELVGKKDKIRIDVRPDDGIRYDRMMFDTAPLRTDIGEYVTTSFENGIEKTAEWLKSYLVNSKG